MLTCISACKKKVEHFLFAGTSSQAIKFTGLTFQFAWTTLYSQMIKRGFAKITVLMFVVISMAMNWHAFRELKEIGTALHLVANENSKSSNHGHHHKTSAKAHVHKHQHSPDQKEHEHTHTDPGLWGTVSTFTSPQSIVFKFLGLIVPSDISLPANEQIPTNSVLRSIFRPPIA